jgi:hypothetical protein
LAQRSLGTLRPNRPLRTRRTLGPSRTGGPNSPNSTGWALLTARALRPLRAWGAVRTPRPLRTALPNLTIRSVTPGRPLRAGCARGPRGPGQSGRVAHPTALRVDHGGVANTHARGVDVATSDIVRLRSNGRPLGAQRPTNPHARHVLRLVLDLHADVERARGRQVERERSVGAQHSSEVTVHDIDFIVQLLPYRLATVRLGVHPKRDGAGPGHRRLGQVGEEPLVGEGHVARRLLAERGAVQYQEPDAAEEEPPHGPSLPVKNPLPFAEVVRPAEPVPRRSPAAPMSGPPN